VDRFSIACFVDPDEDVSLRDVLDDLAAAGGNMSIADYLRWRSGDGDGVAFGSEQEAGRLRCPR
jgi:hypothetical protein